MSAANGGKSERREPVSDVVFAEIIVLPILSPLLLGEKELPRLARGIRDTGPQFAWRMLRVERDAQPNGLLLPLVRGDRAKKQYLILLPIFYFFPYFLFIYFFLLFFLCT
jgi:hypothetical protein